MTGISPLGMIWGALTFPAGLQELVLAIWLLVKSFCLMIATFSLLGISQEYAAAGASAHLQMMGNLAIDATD